MPWGEGLGTGGLESGWGEDFKGDFKRSKGEVPFRCAHVTHETTRDVVGLGNPIERFLATTGRCNRRWDGRQLEMTQDARDHRLLGDGGNDPERATAAQGTRGHIQMKHAPQEPGPVPIRGTRLRLLAAHPLLARRRENRLCPPGGVCGGGIVEGLPRRTTDWQQ